MVSIEELTGDDTGGAPILAYLLEIDQAGGGSGPWTTVQESLTTSATIQDLTEGEPYFLRYRAKNAHGYGEPSTVFYTIMATIPDQILSLSTVNNDVNVVISWDATPDDRDSVVTAYRITIHSKQAVGIEQEMYCKGTETAIVNARSCTVPISVLTADPYFLEEGDLIVA